MQNNLIELKNLIDDELKLYEQLSDLFEEKRKTLIANNVEQLLKVDDEILKITDALKSSVGYRYGVCERLGNRNMTLSNMIEIAALSDEELALDFATAKERASVLKQSMTAKETVIKELLRHGMVMVSKTLNMISNTASIAGDYNSSGKNVQSEIDNISLIVEEA